MYQRARGSIAIAVTCCALVPFPAATIARASDRIDLCKGVEARLTTSDPVVQAGVVPRFRLTLRNRTEQARKILDIRKGRRPDFEHAYFRVEVRKDGAAVDLPRPICDPGPISDADYFRLPPGGEEKISLSEPCVDLRALPPGRYTAHVLLSLDPFAGPDTRCRSAEASFEVRK